MKRYCAFVLVTLWGLLSSLPHAQGKEYDIVIYGGTAGGIISAVSAAREGKSVVILEPSQHVGGMVTGGLGRTDIGVWQSIGGMSAEFYRRVGKHYADPSAWKFESREDFLSRSDRDRQRLSGAEWWFHEPSVATKIFKEMLEEQGLAVRTGRRLQSVQKEGRRMVLITCENGETYAGSVFIDATYEGDLMAMAGVSYHVGRESADQYGEKFAGVLPWEYSTRKQWDVDVSPYDDGNLLYGIQNVERGDVGAGDHKVQAYNYRICLTDAPENRIPITEPDNYDPSRYDLLARYVAKRGHLPLFKPSGNWGYFKPGTVPNHKTDINDGGPFSTDFIGMNWDYPDGDQATREAILKEHLDYTKGLLYFVGHDPRVPEAIREEMLQWGYPKDEYTENGHWTPQLYVREARRMVGAHVVTSHDIETNRTKADSIGMGSYGADSHLVQRIAWNGVVRNEGNPNDFTPGHNTWEIPYRSITPKKAECENLLVTFCVSASHMGFASVRMEPVFMIVSESAALAATLAIDKGLAVQDVPYERLHPKLLQRKQKLKLEDAEGH